jgi:transposase
MRHYHLERKRAAVDVYRSVKRFRTEVGTRRLGAYSLASVAAGGASERQIRDWLKSDLSEDAQQQHEENRGRPRVLSEDQEMLLVGFASSTRSSLHPVQLKDLKRFSESYLGATLSLSTLSRVMSEHGLTSQKGLTRNSRMVSPEVVQDALAAIEEIRSYDFPPHRIITMDETGLWSNVSAPKTYHFKNWSGNPPSMNFTTLL